MKQEIKIIDEISMPSEMDRGIRGLLCRCFPADADNFCRTRSWHGSSPAWSVVLLDNAEIRGHVGIVDRCILAGSKRVRVAGIQNVATDPECRGRGYGSIIMNASMKEAASRGYDAGLLYCLPELQKLYEKCGWILLPKEQIIRVDSDGTEIPLPDKNIAMFHPLKLSKFPTGTIHLQGNDW